MVGTRVQEVHEVVQPVVELLEEFKVDDMGWAGVRLARGILESA
jgi:hypothetical protein